jgi:hypothetical protein
MPLFLPFVLVPGTRISGEIEAMPFTPPAVFGNGNTALSFGISSFRFRID